MKKIITIALSSLIFAANTATITVKTSAEVNSQVIRLADVAEYACSDEEKVKFDKVTVGMINEPGGQRILTLSKIKIGLAQCGIDYNKQEYLGADKITVTRKVIDAAVADNMTKSAHEWLQNKMIAEGNDIELTLISSPQLSYAPTGEYTVSFSESGTNNTRVVQAIVVKDGNICWKGNYTFSIHHYAMVLTAGKLIPRGMEINSADLILARKDITALSSLPIAMKNITGIRAANSINTGEIITAANTDKMPVVKRNSKVIVKAYCGVMMISMVATACEDGSINDIIRVENPENHQLYYARVKAPAELEIVR